MNQQTLSEKNDVVDQPTKSSATILAENPLQPVELHDDIGLQLFMESLRIDPERRNKVAKRVVKKLDFGLLPAMCLICLMSFLDKLTLNYANAYNLQKDLGLHGRDYSWVAAIVNFGFVAGAYPASFCLQRFRIGKVIAIMLLICGALLMITSVAKNFAGIMVLRFLLGFFETALPQAWLLLTTIFWIKDEQPLRMCFWMGSNGIAQIIGSGVSWGIGFSHLTMVTPWQLIFLTVGSFTFVLGVLAIFFLPSSPLDAVFFTHEEKVVSVWRVAQNHTGIKHSKFLTYQAYEALLEPRTWCIAIQQIAIGIINGAISNFFSALLKGFGFSSQEALKYQLPNGAFQFVCTVLVGFICSKVPNTRIFAIIGAQIPLIAGLIGIATIPLKHHLALAACCWILSVFGAAIILNWSLVATNYAGHTKRMTMNGLVFVCNYGGNIIGPFLFIPSEAPRYITAIKTLCGVCGASILATVLAGVFMFLENRRRDRAAASSEPEVVDGEIEGFTDHTDREIRNFRYQL